MGPFFKRQRKPGWMAILPEDGTVTLAYIVRGPAARPEVRLLDSFALDHDLCSALQRLRVARQLESYACTTLIGAEQCTVTQLDAPAVPKEERKEALRWALKETVSYPVESACIDVLDIPDAGLPSGRAAGVLVVSVPEHAVRACASVFEDAKISLDVIDIPELAQRNVAALFEDENRGLAFLHINERGMMLTLTYHGELVAVRRGEMNTQQLSQSNGDQCARVRERLVLELQRSLDNFDRQYGHIPISKVILSCYPKVQNLADDLRESTYVPVLEMDLSSVMDFSGVPELTDPEGQAKNLLVLGAALRTPQSEKAAA